MYTQFVNKYLTSVTWATEEEKKQDWQIQGIIKKQSNQFLKFDISFLKELPNNLIGKRVTSKSKSDKILLETKLNWVLIDTQEVIQYIVQHKLKSVKLKDLIDKLEWNIILKK